eukprot:3941285-Rhodomonas_salina.2
MQLAGEAFRLGLQAPTAAGEGLGGSVPEASWLGATRACGVADGWAGCGCRLPRRACQALRGPASRCRQSAGAVRACRHQQVDVRYALMQ